MQNRLPGLMRASHQSGIVNYWQCEVSYKLGLIACLVVSLIRQRVVRRGPLVHQVQAYDCMHSRPFTDAAGQR